MTFYEMGTSNSGESLFEDVSSFPTFSLMQTCDSLGEDITLTNKVEDDVINVLDMTF